MKIREDIENILLSEKYFQLATVSEKEIPNICTIGAFYLEDEKIIIIDNYFNKTLENINNNNNVSILIRKEKESYQLKGKGKYFSSGEVYLKAREWMKNKNDKYPAKGVLIVNVEDIYNSIPGDNAGEKIDN